jgi:hypothetical protein
MANPERGEQQFTAGDETYILRLTTAAARDVEARTGRTLRDIQLGATLRGSVTDSCWLLWAALQNRHAATIKTLDDIDRLVDAAGGFDAINAQLETFMALNAAPDQQKTGEGDEARPPGAQPRISGVASTSMPASLA